MGVSHLPVSSIKGIPVHVDIIKPRGNRNVRRLIPIKTPIYIVVHNTANTSKTADDRMHQLYLQNLENTDSAYVSWHFTVDEDSITQNLPLNEPGYHAGDGSGIGNSNGIAIEICENGDYAKAEANAMELIRYLQSLLGVPDSRVKPHFYFSGKICPRRIIKSKATADKDWADFMARLNRGGKTTPPAPPKAEPSTKPSSITVGSTVTVSPSASNWATGQTIPSWVKGKKYKVKQVNGDKVLLDSVISWIFIKDLQESGEVSTPTLKVGSVVKVRGSASKYATGQTIPSWVKGRSYKVTQVKSDRVLLHDINSWFYIRDVEIVS